MDHAAWYSQVHSHQILFSRRYSACMKKRNYTMIHLLRYLQSKNTKTLFLTSCSSGPSLVTKTLYPRV